MAGKVWYYSIPIVVICAIIANLYPYFFDEAGEKRDGGTKTPLFTDGTFIKPLLLHVTIAIILDFIYIIMGDVPNALMSLQIGVSAPIFYRQLAEGGGTRQRREN